MPIAPMTALVLSSFAGVEPPQSPTTLTAVPSTAVRVVSAFWSPRLTVARDGILAQNVKQCEQTGRLGNFDRASGKEQGPHRGLFFDDSDVYKVIEGWSYVIGIEQDAAKKAELEKACDAVIVRIVAAQRPDGYINTYYTLKEGLDKRWTRERDMHETYCIGHLIEAGVAHFEATGKRTLLDCAIKAADHVDSIFGPGKLADPPGHEEIELSLVKLARVTHDEKYLKLARFLVECRGKPRPGEGGKPTLFGDYCQDTMPVREQREAMGHAVRAGYLYSAVTDLARLDHDAGYTAAVDGIWDDITQRRMYITGGIGPSAHNEGFTTPYDLPNATAYQETCASISLALWAHRMNLLHADAKYMDVFETSLYNAILAGVSLDGSRYFYVNPLASSGNHARQEWFGCACCPPNILRFISSLGGYEYAAEGDTAYVNLFVGGESTIQLASGAIKISQTTNVPVSGGVTIIAAPGKSTKPLHLAVRAPAWSGPATKVMLNGKAVPMNQTTRGYWMFDVPGSEAVKVELALDMTPRRVYADPRVAANRGRAAVMTGPIVQAWEAIDNTKAGSLSRVVMGTGATITPDVETGWSKLAGVGLPIVTVAAQQFAASMSDELYQSSPRLEPVTLKSVPYFAWNNRGRGEMVVWLAETPSVLELGPLPGIKPTASFAGNGDGPGAMCDRLEPSSSNDHSIPRFTWWNHLGTTEWVQFDFDKPRTLARADVYWFDDKPIGGGCRVPETCAIEYRDGDTWKPVTNPKGLGTRIDAFNLTTFDPVTTKGLRLKVQLSKDMSGGILEWRVGK